MMFEARLLPISVLSLVLLVVAVSFAPMSAKSSDALVNDVENVLAESKDRSARFNDAIDCPKGPL